MKNVLILLTVTFLGLSCANRNIIESKPDPVVPVIKTDSILDVLEVTVDETAKMNEIGDPYQIEKAEINGDILILNLSYGGGCENHEFKMINNFAFFENVDDYENHIESGTRLTLVHNGNNDRCRSIVRQELRVNLSNIQDKGKNKLTIQLTGWESTLIYAYTTENR